LRPLAEVAEINPKRPVEFRSLDEGTMVSFVPMAAVCEKAGAITGAVSRSFGEVRKGFTYFAEGDVIFAKITPCMQNGKAAVGLNLVNRIGFGSTEFHVLRPTKATAEWLYYFVRSKSFRDEAERHFHGSAGQQRVPEEFMCQALIPDAPADDQRRVVGRIKECLSRVEEMQRLREEMTLEAEALTNATLKELWDRDEIANAPRFSLANLGEITTGNTPSRKVSDYFAETGTPWITPGDMNATKEIITAREFLSPRGIAEARARVLVPNSVAVCCIGATIGKVAIVRQPTGINQQINAITFGSRVLPDYGYWACRALYPEILSNAAQATLPILNKSRFGELSIPVPDKEVQQSTATKLDEVLDASLKLKATALEQAAAEELLRESILREAFAGNL